MSRNAACFHGNRPPGDFEESVLEEARSSGKNSAAPPRREEPDEVAWASGSDASWMSGW